MNNRATNTSRLGERLIYRQLIAGCVPTVAIDAEDAAVQVAANTLGNERLHVISARSDDGIYFLAVPSKLATGGEYFATPLAVALPAHPQHRGDGIYSLAEADVAVIKRPGELLCVSRNDANLPLLAADFALPIYDVGPDVEPWRLESAYGRYRKSAEHVAGRIMRVSRMVLFASLIAYAATALGDVAARMLADRRVAAGATAEAVRRLQYVSPLAEQLAHLQVVFGTVVRAGGWIDGYVWKQGQEVFQISLPGWVSHDYVDALGPGATADFDVADNLVIVRKGDFDALGKTGANDKR